MKKIILTLTVCSMFTMCKKGEAANSSIDSTSGETDSTIADITEKLNDSKNEVKSVYDSASIKIKDFDKTKSKAMETIEETSKSIDSLSKKISSLKLESKTSAKDSSNQSNEKIAVKNSAPKIIKETKVIYKNAPKPKEPSLDKLTKNAEIEINVDNTESSKNTVKQLLSRYDGFLKSENTSSNNNDKQIAYIKAKVPIQQFDYFIDDLSDHLGIVQNKNIEVHGKDYLNNTLCDVEITLYGYSDNKNKAAEEKSFGNKSLAAVSSGWNVITSIFLFILPLWPLFVLGGLGYYFYKRNLNKKSDNNS